VPALQVDRDGNRLGRGGGSYDRALARATGLTVALLHDDELVAELPHEPHDVPVRAVATPTGGLVRLPSRGSEKMAP
jgi:5-formyltetrahydrofolate cyclo-ligase